MKVTYISPQLNIVLFQPMEQLATDIFSLNIATLSLESVVQTRAAGTPASGREDDVFLPIG